MASLLHQLENNDAVLLMYLAGELPAEDRAEIEHLLAQDAGLRASLEALRAVVADVSDVMADSDAAAAPAVASRRPAAVRRVSREIVRRQLDAAARAEADAHARRRGASGRFRGWRVPGWAKPIAVAATLLIAWLAYWGFSAGDAGKSDARRTDDPPALSADAKAAAADLLAADPTDRQALAAAEALDDAAGADLGDLIRRVPPTDDAAPPPPPR